MRRLVSMWIAIYTSPLPRAVRRDRRDELRADIHEQLADGDPARAVALRVLRGARADVAWMLDRALEDVHPLRSPGGTLVLAAPALVGLWLSGLAGHRRGGLTEVVGTTAYFAFWFLLAAVVVAVVAAAVLRRFR